MNDVLKIKEAYARIKPHIHRTNLIKSTSLSKAVDGDVYLKLENEQYTGSFKARGSLNKLLVLTDLQKNKGVVTASTGNHGLGFSRACAITKLAGIVFLPQNAAQAKVKKLRDYPVTLKFVTGNSLQTELAAREYAESKGMTWVSPYNDYDVLHGQGTIACELLEQTTSIDALFATVGGGGLISGIASYLKEQSPQTIVYGCQPALSPEMSLSVEAGKVIGMDENLPTLSDGSAGGIEDDTITLSYCQRFIDEFVLITEEEIKDAIKRVAADHNKIIEGAAGVSVASVLKKKDQLKGKTSVVIICGGNISLDVFKQII
jgi:threonine dehydratase